MSRKNSVSGVTVAVLFCALTVAAVTWFLRRVKVEPEEVRVAHPEYRDIANLVTTNGVVQPITEFQARANFPGMIERVSVELGDKVRAGQMLVTMKDPFAVSRVTTAASAVAAAAEANQDMESGGSQEQRIVAAGDLEHARLAADQAQSSLAALLKLQTHGAASTAEVAAARRRVTDAGTTLATLEKRTTQRYSDAALNASRARVTDAAAALAAAKIAYSNANIATPVSGTIYSVSVSPYDFVPMGADLVRVADLNQMQIRAYFDEPEVGKLKEGQNVTVTWEGRPGQTWHGQIRKAPVAAMPQGSRSVAECVIRIEDSKGELLPNTHVIVTVPIESRSHALTIPRQALQANEQGRWVFRVVDDTLIRTPVTSGLVNLDRVEILAGLSEQDVVAIQTLDDQPFKNKMVVRVVR